MKFFDLNKKNAKPFILITVYFVVLAVILETLSLTAFSKGAAATYANKYSNAYSFYSEPENTIEVAGVGNSNLYSAFVPAKLWQKQGYTSSVIGSPHQTLAQSYDFIVRLYEKQNPKLVIIETDMFYRTLPDGKSYRSPLEIENLLESVFDAADPDNIEDMVKSAFSVFTFHDRWKGLLRGNEKEPKDPNAHGYHLHLKRKKFKPGDYMAKTDVKEEMKQSDLKTLDSIMSYCRDKGSEVLWVSAPSPKFWCYARHNYVSGLAKKYGVNFVDYNLKWQELDLKAQSDFRDKGTHLNFNGAKKFTFALGNYLKENYALEDYRGNDRYAYFEESANRFDDDVKALRKKEKEKKAK